MKNTKIIWGIVIAVVVIVGAIAYFQISQRYDCCDGEQYKTENNLVASSTPTVKTETSKPVQPTPRGGDLGYAIQVLSPKTGDVFKIGSKMVITWKDRNDAASYTISVVNRTTSKVESVIANNVFLRSSGIDGTTSYEWTVPALDTKASYNIEIYQATARELTGRSQLFTITNAAAAAPSITILSPNGGEMLAQNTKHSITWSSTGLNPDDLINIIFRTPEPDWKPCRGIEVKVGSGKFDFVPSQVVCKQDVGTLPSLTPGRYKVQIGVNKYSDGRGVADTSDNYFTITNVPATTQSSITSISSISGAVGTVVEIKGYNLIDARGNQNVIIENSKGETASFGFGNPTNLDLSTHYVSMKFTVTKEVCKGWASDAGLPCSAGYLILTPGTYSIYVKSQESNSISNKISFTITN